jgi:hypothetical protein
MKNEWIIQGILDGTAQVVTLPNGISGTCSQRWSEDGGFRDATIPEKVECCKNRCEDMFNQCIDGTFSHQRCSKRKDACRNACKLYSKNPVFTRSEDGGFSGENEGDEEKDDGSVVLMYLIMIVAVVVGIIVIEML